MKKLTTKILLTAVALSAAVIMPAQNAAPAAPVAPPAAPAAAKPAPTLEQILAPLPDVLAESGSYKVTKAELLGRLKDMDGAAAILGQMPENIRNIQLRRVVENMIYEEYYIDLAKKAGYKVDKAWAKEKLMKNFAELPKEQQEQIKQQLAQDKKTLEQFIDESLKNETQVQFIAIGSFMDDKFKQALAKVSDADVQKFYADNKETQFKQPEMVRVAHILIMPVDPQKFMSAGATKEEWAAAEAKVKAVLERLKKGEDFAVVAAEVSSCPSGKQSKGELPPFTGDGSMIMGGQGKMDPDFTKASYALAKAGDVSAPVKTMFGYHIIKLLEKTPASYIELNDQIKAQVKQVLAQETVGKELNALRAALPIKVYGLEVKAEPAAK